MTDMTKNRWQKMQELFNNAVDLSRESRSDFLDASCAEDFELCREIGELLKIDDENDSILDRSVWHPKLLFALNAEGNPISSLHRDLKF